MSAARALASASCSCRKSFPQKLLWVGDEVSLEIQGEDKYLILNKLSLEVVEFIQGLLLADNSIKFYGFLDQAPGINRDCGQYWRSRLSSGFAVRWQNKT